MFDIGFTEIIVIALVALVVIGPSRLPEAMRSCAMWIGRAKRTLSSVRRDLEDEIGINEIRQDLRNEQIMADLKTEKLADERERQEKEKARAQNPHGNNYLDNTYNNDAQAPGEHDIPTQQPEPTNQPQSTDNNN